MVTFSSWCCSLTDFLSVTKLLICVNWTLFTPDRDKVRWKSKRHLTSSMPPLCARFCVCCFIRYNLHFYSTECGRATSRATWKFRLAFLNKLEGNVLLAAAAYTTKDLSSSDCIRMHDGLAIQIPLVGEYRVFKSGGSGSETTWTLPVLSLCPIASNRQDYALIRVATGPAGPHARSGGFRRELLEFDEEELSYSYSCLSALFIGILYELVGRSKYVWSVVYLSHFWRDGGQHIYCLPRLVRPKEYW